MDGHLPSPGWSPTIPRMVPQQREVYYKLGIYYLNLTHKTIFIQQLPWMVTNQPQEGPTPKACYRLGVWHLTDKTNNCQRCSPAIPRMVTHHPKDGHSQSKIWSLPFPKMVTHCQRMVTNHPQHDQTPYPGWSPTIQRYGNSPSWGWSPTNRMVNTMFITFPRMVTRHFQDDQLVNSYISRSHYYQPSSIASKDLPNNFFLSYMVGAASISTLFPKALQEWPFQQLECYTLTNHVTEWL